MKVFVDQMNNSIRLDNVPSRIVSLVPSQTELLHEFGLEKEVLGITKFCIHPNEWFTTKTRIGGTKTVDFNKVSQLNPDLIIGNKEENEKDNIEELTSIAPIWMSDIFGLDDALEMISQLGEICNVPEKSNQLINNIQQSFEKLDHYVQLNPLEKNVIYYIWSKPDMVAGSGTFIDEMLLRCGLRNIQTEERYPVADESKVPDLIFLSSEPFPFKEKHIKQFQDKYPKAKVFLVDGEYFSWYGSRLKDAPDYFITLLKKIRNKT